MQDRLKGKKVMKQRKKGKGMKVLKVKREGE